MGTTIYWFSGTGNSLQAAKDLAVALGGAELWPMLRGRFPLEGERVVFAFPLFYLSYPKAVRAFIASFEPVPGTEHIAMVSRGFKGMGGVLRELDRDLRAKGSKLDRGFYLDMPNNDLVMFSPSQGAEAARRNAAARARIAEEAGRIKAGKAGRIQAEPFRFLRRARTAAYEGRIRESHLKFSVDHTCTSCGICAKLCPLNRIELVEGKPRWLSGCQECEACINWCPARAIQYAGSNSERKGRYRHPEVLWKEIAAQRPR